MGTDPFSNPPTSLAAAAALTEMPVVYAKSKVQKICNPMDTSKVLRRPYLSYRQEMGYDQPPTQKEQNKKQVNKICTTVFSVVRRKILRSIACE